jgi:hypothetical protein
MSVENEHAIITDEEEIKRLFPSPLLPFGALELSSQSRSNAGTKKRLGAGKNDGNAEIQGAEGGVRSRMSTVCENISGPLILPDSKEYLSSLERMIHQSRAKLQWQPGKQPKSDIEMDSIVLSAVQSASEDDERAPFIKAVCASSLCPLHVVISPIIVYFTYSFLWRY